MDDLIGNKNKFLVILGTIESGLRFHGLFDTWDEAAEYLHNYGGAGTVSLCYEPTEAS